MGLGFTYFYMSFKNKQKEEDTNLGKAQNENPKGNTYTKIPVFNFMQFDKIEDNMIVQDNGAKYLQYCRIAYYK